MKIGEALELLKQGKKVARKNWNGKGQYLLYVPYEEWGINENLGIDVSEIYLNPWIGIKSTENKFVPWFASQTDILAEDWIEVN